MKQHETKISIDRELWEVFIKAAKCNNVNEKDYLEDILKAQIECDMHDGFDVELPKRLQARLRL